MGTRDLRINKLTDEDDSRPILREQDEIESGRYCWETPGVIDGRLAFTLIELIVVLVLVAMIAAMVTVRWSGFQNGPALEAAVNNVEFIDAHMRRYASAHGRTCGLEIDLKNHRLAKQYHDDDHDNPRSEKIGSNVRVKQVDCQTERSRGATFQLTYYPDGTTPTYGLQLAGPGKKEAYLLFAGMSGQMTRFSTLSEYENAMSLLKTN